MDAVEGTDTGQPPLNLAEYEAAATRRLGAQVADFVNRGNLDNRTVARNQQAFAEILLNAYRFVDVSERDLTTTVLGRQVALPVLVAPTGLHGVAHPDGELATARAAARAGTVMFTGTMATTSVADVAAATSGPTWFQLYHLGRDVLELFVRRAEQAQCAAVCVTVDVPVQTRGREHDRRNGFRASKGRRLANFETDGPLPGGLTAETVKSWKRRPLRPVTQDDLAWLREITSLPLIVKGILTAEDAVTAVETGADAIIVSNHGGRECDCVPATIEVLPDIVDAVGGRAEIYLDGGIRRGSDVVKALALGARAVLIGRPFWWGLAVGGEDGVFAVLDILRREIDEVLAAIGCRSVADLGRRFVRAPVSDHPRR